MNRGELVSRERRAIWLLILLILFAVALGLGLWIARGAAGPPTPVISPIGLPKDVTSQRSAHFRFSAARPVTFECALDAQPFTTCGANVVGSKSYPGPLPLGQHTFKVRAALGHRTSPAATYSWFILRSSKQPPSQAPVSSSGSSGGRPSSSGSGGTSSSGSGGSGGQGSRPAEARGRGIRWVVGRRDLGRRDATAGRPGSATTTTSATASERAGRHAVRDFRKRERARAWCDQGDRSQAREPELRPHPRHTSDGLRCLLRARSPVARAPISSSTRRLESRALRR